MEYATSESVGPEPPLLAAPVPLELSEEPPQPATAASAPTASSAGTVLRTCEIKTPPSQSDFVGFSLYSIPIGHVEIVGTVGKVGNETGQPSAPRGRYLSQGMSATEERRHVTRSRANPGGMDVLKVLGPEVRPFRERKPPWFKVPAPGGPKYRDLTAMIKQENLHTVCQEAACPNVGECWERGTATFMILGDTCTRRCGFCNVQTGKPTWNDPLEPARVARSVAKMGLRHAVITSVDRDDLPDYGASAFVGVIRSIRQQAPQCKVEVLTPDFRGQEMPLAKVIAERPDVFNHNCEVVPRLYPVARRGSEFLRSARVLKNAKEMGGDEVVTKSGLMVGLGETHEEMVETFGILREHHVQVLTVGQYLRPTERHLPIVRYWHPEEFKALEDAAYALGFDHIAAGPLVRSSYHADQHVPQQQPGTGPLAA